MLSYEIGTDYVQVLFRDSDRIYKYSYVSAGEKHVEKMKRLAVLGIGLSTYISRYVKDNYE